MPEANIKRATLDEIRGMRDRGELHDSSNAPEVAEVDDEFWVNAVLVPPMGSTSVHLKLDPDVFDFFKNQGKGHITRMQDVLKAYVKAQKARQVEDITPGE